MRTLIKVCALALLFSIVASVGTASGPSKIDKSIYGFYLGESKASLLERAKKEGVACAPKGRMQSEFFPECYRFDKAMDKSKDVKFAIVSFYKDRAGEVTVHFADGSDRKYLQAAQGLEQSWNSFAGFSDQNFGPMYIVTLPDVLITLVSKDGATHASYVHRAMLGAYNEERNGGVNGR